MANVYGSRNLNQFPLPSVESEETYYTLVNPENGEITLKRLNKLVIDSPVAQNFDPIVGTIAATGPNKGKFIPNTGSTTIGVSGATPTEIKAFAQQPQALRTVKEKAQQTSNNAQQALGVDQTTRQSRTNEILATGQASTSTTGDQIGGEGSTPYDTANRDAGGALLNEAGDGIKTRGGTRLVTEYPNENLLRYPIDMNTKQDCVKFTMLEYVSRKLDISSSNLDILSEKRSRSEKQIGSTVVLPIQPNISDTNTVRWGSEDMNALQGMAASLAMKAISGDSNFAATASELSDVAKGITSGKDSIKTALAAEFAGRAAQLPGLLSRVTGGILNPNMELLFNGPDLRTFNFNFSLSAREPKEAKNIRNIIRFFKQGMSVKRADTGLFLKAPHTFQIKYLHDGTDHPWIGKIKECALTSCTVNYTPAGNYATYEDGAMTQYDLSLSFSELEPLYDDLDYGKGGLNSDEFEIGY